MIGETDESQQKVVELSCNLDDITPEDISFARDVLFEHGALDVYTVTIEVKRDQRYVCLYV